MNNNYGPQHILIILVLILTAWCVSLNVRMKELQDCEQAAKGYKAYAASQDREVNTLVEENKRLRRELQTRRIETEMYEVTR